MIRGAEATPKGFRSRKVRPYRQLEDHMFHHAARLASEHNKPFQIHTGILAGNGADGAARGWSSEMHSFD